MGKLLIKHNIQGDSISILKQFVKQSCSSSSNHSNSMTWLLKCHITAHTWTYFPELGL